MKSIVLFFIGTIVFSMQGLAQADVQKKLQKQLILADAGAVIELPEGVFEFTNTLSLEEKKKITIRGKGMNKTKLSFKGQTDGAEGIRVSNCDDIVLEGFSVQDAKGDAIKTMHVNNITFRDVKTEWTGTPGPENGGYGFYPVQCDGVMIDKCEAMGASDAGIYVATVAQNRYPPLMITRIKWTGTGEVELRFTPTYANSTLKYNRVLIEL